MAKNTIANKTIEYIENGKYQKALTAELNKITDESNYFEIKK